MTRRKPDPVVRRLIKLTVRSGEDPRVAAFWASVPPGKGAETVIEMTRAHLRGSLCEPMFPVEAPTSEEDAAVDALIGML